MNILLSPFSHLGSNIYSTQAKFSYVQVILLYTNYKVLNIGIVIRTDNQTLENRLSVLNHYNVANNFESLFHH